MTDITQILKNTYFTFLHFNEQIDCIHAAVTFVKHSIKPGQIGIIVSNRVDETQEFINSVIGESEAITVISYEDIDKLYQIAAALIVFDDFDMLNEVKEEDILSEFISEIYDNNNYILALTKKTTTNESIAEFSSRFSELPYHGSLDFISEKDKNGDLVTYDLYFRKTDLSDFQIDYYNMLEDTPNADNNSWRHDSFKEFIYLFNIVYPFEIQKLINNGEPPEISTLVKFFGWENLLMNGPKIKNLIDFININLKGINNQNLRHVIFTSCDNYYGSVLLQGIFENTTIGGHGINSIVLYEDEDYEVKNQKMELFNNQKDDNDDYFYQVLIVSQTYTQTPKDINFFHTLDTNLLTAYDMIEDIYKTKNYTSSRQPINLSVNLHTSHNETQPIDEYLAEGLSNYIVTSYENYNDRYKRGFKITIGNNNRLIVNK
jgi:hypothetical protein